MVSAQQPSAPRPLRVGPRKFAACPLVLGRGELSPRHRAANTFAQSSQVKRRECAVKGTDDWTVQRSVRPDPHAGQRRAAKVVSHARHSQSAPEASVRSEPQAVQRAASGTGNVMALLTRCALPRRACARRDRRACAVAAKTTRQAPTVQHIRLHTSAACACTRRSARTVSGRVFPVHHRAAWCLIGRRADVGPADQQRTLPAVIGESRESSDRFSFRSLCCSSAETAAYAQRFGRTFHSQPDTAVLLPMH